jgi:hypothetical protein
MIVRNSSRKLNEMISSSRGLSSRRKPTQLKLDRTHIATRVELFLEREID